MHNAAHLINSTDLEQASDRIQLRQLLPVLIRRLILATNKTVTLIDFPGDEGVGAPGWDGVVEAQIPSAHIPKGKSVWECGTNKAPNEKANQDYSKRKKKNPKSFAKNITYIFVTTRRWQNKTAWIKRKKSEKYWKNVFVIDADMIAAWLEQAPATHYWISSIVGKSVEDIETLDEFMDGFSSATQPRLTPEILTIGRESLVSTVHNWVMSDDRHKKIRFFSRNNGTVYLAAALFMLKGQQREHILSKTLIIKSPRAWNYMKIQDGELILIPSFMGMTSENNISAGNHRILQSIGKEDEPGLTESFPVDHKGIKAFETKLHEFIQDEVECRYLAYLWPQDLNAFRRRLAVHPELSRPRWAKPIAGRKMLAPMLIGAWVEANSKDLECLEALTCEPWAKQIDTLVPWLFQDDPPITCIGGSWSITSRTDSWNLLAPFLTHSDLDNFKKIACLVLETSNPSVDEDFIFNLDLRKSRPPHFSPAIRKGIAEQIAQMCNENELKPLAQSSFSQVAESIIYNWFEAAAKNPKLWVLLADEDLFRYFAEASPDLFLTKLEEIIIENPKVFDEVFIKTDNSLLSKRSPHPGLMWALEVIGRIENYFPQVINILIALHEISHQKIINNTPLESALSLLCLWYPQTDANFEKRKFVIDSILKNKNEIGWIILTNLLPGRINSATENPKPRWYRSYKAKENIITQRDLYYNYLEILEIAFSQSEGNSNRWNQLLKQIHDWPEVFVSKLIDCINLEDITKFSETSRESLRSTLREIHSRHKSHSDSGWAYKARLLQKIKRLYNKLEPENIILKYGWIFSRNPTLLEGRKYDYVKDEQKINKERINSIEFIFKAGGWEYIKKLIKNAESPEAVGYTFSKINNNTRLENLILLNYLTSENLKNNQFCRGYIYGMFEKYGSIWSDNIYEKLKKRMTVKQRANFHLYLPFDAVRVKSLTAKPARIYWTNFIGYGLGEKYDEIIPHSLVIVNRPFAALEMLCLYHKNDSSWPVDLLEKILKEILKPTHKIDAPSDMTIHYLEKIYKSMKGNASFPETLLLQIDLLMIQANNISWVPSILNSTISSDPAIFIEAIQIAYIPKGQQRRALSEEEQAKAGLADGVLRTWSGIPGLDQQNTFNKQKALDWIERMKAELSTSGHLAAGLLKLGNAMGRYTGHGTPGKETCLLIELISEPDFDQGFETGIFNSRGVHSRSMYAGGQQERDLATHFDSNAEQVKIFPRTSAIMRRLAETYRRLGGDQDREEALLRRRP
ncbi:hypothetical protein [Geothrix oryzisoli]|uniref:hypothetical protein n=1 Tax=Geothrix oryzisoli TaxID=2922721 RepID=UPI001FABCC7A|nr:hypothetical protein [Geothrix oryzisoli]